MNAMDDDQVDDAELESISGGWDYPGRDGCPSCGFTVVKGGPRKHYCMNEAK